MLALLLVACAPLSTMAPPDPFAATGSHSLGARVSGGAAIPTIYPTLSPQVWFVGHPNPRMEIGASGFVGARGIDWPRQIDRGGAGGYLRIYGLRQEKLALGLQLESTVASWGVGGAAFFTVAPRWDVYAVPGLGVDLGASAGGDHPFHVDCGFFVRAPAGVVYSRNSLRFGLEVDTLWSPLAGDIGRTDCGVDTFVDALPALFLQGGLSVSWTLPQREPG